MRLVHAANSGKIRGEQEGGGAFQVNLDASFRDIRLQVCYGCRDRGLDGLER